MRFSASIFSELLKPVSHRWHKAAVGRLGSDAYDKCFSSWDHMAVLIFAQLSSSNSLRGIEAAWNANAHHHYHLKTGKIARSTIADANARRPPAIFLETFAKLVGLADPGLRREGREMVRLIDSTPIPLDQITSWSTWNGRIKGMKLHVVYDPHSATPRLIDMTPATLNDISFANSLRIETGATYVFDKAYCSYTLWARINAEGATFVTRQKTNAHYHLTRRRDIETATGDGFRVLDDAEVRLVTKGNARLAIPMRRIRVKRDQGGTLTLLTNDLKRSAVEIAQLYKTRWQIELLFRWIKQHLKLAKFLGRSENAVKLQIITAVIAYLLLHIAAATSRLKMRPIRFAELIGSMLFIRKPITKISKPPDVNPSRPKPQFNSKQLGFQYA